MKSKKLLGTSLIELLVALVIVGLLTVVALPAVARLVKVDGLGKDKEALTLSITLEKLISVLQDSRAILAPRARRGARRAPILLFLDKHNEVCAVSCFKEQLILRRLSTQNKSTCEEKLGPCSAVIFHDRGRTRRCLRIRLLLGDYVLATTIKLTNRPQTPALSMPLSFTEPQSSRSFSLQLESAKERYFQRKPSPENLLASMGENV